MKIFLWVLSRKCLLVGVLPCLYNSCRNLTCLFCSEPWYWVHITESVHGSVQNLMRLDFQKCSKASWHVSDLLCHFIEVLQKAPHVIVKQSHDKFIKVTALSTVFQVIDFEGTVRLFDFWLQIKLKSRRFSVLSGLYFFCLQILSIYVLQNLECPYCFILASLVRCVLSVFNIVLLLRF